MWNVNAGDGRSHRAIKPIVALGVLAVATGGLLVLVMPTPPSGRRRSALPWQSPMPGGTGLPSRAWSAAEILWLARFPVLYAGLGMLVVARVRDSAFGRCSTA